MLLLCSLWLEIDVVDWWAISQSDVVAKNNWKQINAMKLTNKDALYNKLTQMHVEAVISLGYNYKKCHKCSSTKTAASLLKLVDSK